MSEMLHQPPSTNKYIKTGSDEEYEKYKERAWNLAEQVENDFMRAESYIEEHDLPGFKMADGSVIEDSEELSDWLFGDSKDLATKANVEDSINWVMGCPLAERFCSVDRDDLILACEFIRCFGN